MVGALEPLTHAARAGVVGGRGEDPITVELAVDLAQVGRPQLDVLIRVEHLLGRGQRDAELACGFLGGCRHQLHQAAGPHAGARVVHKGAFLAGNGKYPA